MFTENLNPFELGYQSTFLIVSNIVIFGFGIAYYKKKIPSLIRDIVEKIRTFEIPKNDENNAGKITGVRVNNTTTRVQKKTA